MQTLLAGEGNRAALFDAVLKECSQGPTIVVLEDIHWADEATLDLITFLARRIRRTSTLLILTYRDDELRRDHLLRLVLGDLPARDVTRLRLPPLSENAVATLARKARRSIKHLHTLTGGNPFFLTEVLASEDPGTPATIYDAVLGRMSRRSPAAQRLLELVAAVPTRIEWQIVAAIPAEGDMTLALEECVAAGMLHLEGTAVGRMV